MKAFKKAEPAILVRQYDETTFSFRRVIVESCGAVRMTLKDAVTGEMLGTDFDAIVGFGNRRVNMEKIAAEFAVAGRPIHHCYRTGVFKDMTDEEAATFTTECSASFIAWEIKDAERKASVEKDEYGETAFYKRQVQKLADFKATVPGFHKH